LAALRRRLGRAADCPVQPHDGVQGRLLCLL